MYNTDLPTRAELPSTCQLFRSTAIAALVAALLLVTAVLPAEYGIDPLGVGRVLGLTPMGEIKVALAAEASVADAKPADVTPENASPVAAAQPIPAQTPAHGHDHGGEPGHDHDHAPAVAAPSAVAAAPVADLAAAVPARQNTVTVKLKPGEAAEIKLAMRKDASVRFEWRVQGGTVNYDTHGDPVGAAKNFYHGYGKGRNETAQTGTLQAAFDGKHGWFWRNRSGAEVTVTLHTDGDYDSIERVL